MDRMMTNTSSCIDDYLTFRKSYLMYIMNTSSSNKPSVSQSIHFS